MAEGSSKGKKGRIKSTDELNSRPLCQVTEIVTAPSILPNSLWRLRIRSKD